MKDLTEAQFDRLPPRMVLMVLARNAERLLPFLVEAVDEAAFRICRDVVNLARLLAGKSGGDIVSGAFTRRLLISIRDTLLLPENTTPASISALTALQLTAQIAGMWIEESGREAVMKRRRDFRSVSFAVWKHTSKLGDERLRELFMTDFLDQGTAAHLCADLDCHQETIGRETGGPLISENWTEHHPVPIVVAASGSVGEMEIVNNQAHYVCFFDNTHDAQTTMPNLEAAMKIALKLGKRDKETGHYLPEVAVVLFGPNLSAMAYSTAISLGVSVLKAEDLLTKRPPQDLPGYVEAFKEFLVMLQGLSTGLMAD